MGPGGPPTLIVFNIAKCIKWIFNETNWEFKKFLEENSKSCVFHNNFHIWAVLNLISATFSYFKVKILKVFGFSLIQSPPCKMVVWWSQFADTLTLAISSSTKFWQNFYFQAFTQLFPRLHSNYNTAQISKIYHTSTSKQGKEVWNLNWRNKLGLLVRQVAEVEKRADTADISVLFFHWLC